MRYKGNGYILYGAGQQGKALLHIFKCFGIDVTFFVDGDPAKWDCLIGGVKVLPPMHFFEMYRSSRQKVVLASGKTEEIYLFLLENDVLESDILTKEAVVKEVLLANVTPEERVEEKERTIIFDMGAQALYGGVETMVTDIVCELNQRCVKAYAIYPHEKHFLPEKCRDYVHTFNFFTNREGERCEHTYWGSTDLQDIDVKERLRMFIAMLEEMLPCTIVLSMINMVYLAAVYLKRKYPGQVKIISMMHSPVFENCLSNQREADELDHILCVGQNIKQNLIQNFGVPEGKVAYHINPVIGTEYMSERMFGDAGKIRIGMVSRLDKYQKRADRIPELISELEACGVDYILDIVGDGDQYEFLDEAIKRNDWNDRVRLLGRLDGALIPDFWMEHDIYVNISEFEGLSIAMLEAMLYGAVPVVTDVNEEIHAVITDGHSGFLCAVSDFKGMASCIAKLQKERARLQMMSNNGSTVVRDKCSLHSYVDDLMEFLM